MYPGMKLKLNYSSLWKEFWNYVKIISKDGHGCTVNQRCYACFLHPKKCDVTHVTAIYWSLDNRRNCIFQ